MRLCEFKQKEVINCCDCQRLGYVADVEFNCKTGVITHIIVPGPCRIWGIIGRDHEYVIPYCCIKQIGPDVILVDVDINKVLVRCEGF